MRIIYLLRHAKSSWAEADLADHDRPLAPRGRRDAGAMAEHLSAADVRPGLVLCSSARRTVQTFELISAGLPAGTEVRVEEGLYGASMRELLERLRWTRADLRSVLLIGHNPGIHDLAVGLLSPEHRDPRLARKFPTAALATLAIPGSRWRDLVQGHAELVAFVVPRALAGPS